MVLLRSSFVVTRLVTTKELLNTLVMRLLRGGRVCVLQLNSEAGALIMAALPSRRGHYIFALWFLLLFLLLLLLLLLLCIFFPRLISAVENWMSTILPHRPMVSP